MQLEKLAQILRGNGIVGAGGAGFPAYAKLDKKADTVILNCAECEPLFKVHRQILEKYAFEIVSALSEVAKTVGAKNAIVAIKPSYKEAIESVENAIKAYPEITISYLPEIYPAGDEVILTYEVTGRAVKPGNIPLSVGVTVFNVETMYDIYRAITDNAPVTHKYVMVAGEVKNPSVLKVPIGTTYKELVALCGGATVKDAVYIIGGPMTGKIGTPGGMITKTTNAVILLPQDHYIVQRKTVNTTIGMKRAMSACCSCRVCTDLCSRNLMGSPINPQEFMHGISHNKVFDSKPFINTFYCSQCGLCEMYSCMQGLSPASIIATYRDGLRANGVTPPKNPEYSGVNSKRKYRTVPVSRLVRRLGLTKYNVEAPLTDKEILPNRLTISLSQNIGATDVAIVKKGDTVSAGQLIASPPADKLGVDLHAPIDGVVKEVTKDVIIIEKIRK